MSCFHRLFFSTNDEDQGDRQECPDVVVALYCLHLGIFHRVCCAISVPWREKATQGTTDLSDLLFNGSWVELII